MTKTSTDADFGSESEMENTARSGVLDSGARYETVDGVAIITDARLPGRELRIEDDDGVWKITREGEDGKPETARLQIIDIEDLDGSGYREIVEKDTRKRYGSDLAEHAWKLSWPMTHSELKQSVMELCGLDPDDPEVMGRHQPVGIFMTDEDHDAIRFVTVAYPALFDVMADICGARLAAQTPRSKLQITRDNGKLDPRMEQIADAALNR